MVRLRPVHGVDRAGTPAARPAGAAGPFARRCGADLVLYIWDLPPGGVGLGRHDAVWWIAGRFPRLPLLWGWYGRAEHFSRLRHVARRATAVWVPSGMTQASVAERFEVRAQRVPHWYDPNRFAPVARTRGMAGDATVTLLTVSRLRRHKSQAGVINAAALRKRAVRVRLIGRGPQQANLEARGPEYRAPSSPPPHASCPALRRS